MNTVKLSDGKEYPVDTSQMTVREWRGLKSALFTTAQDDVVISKCVSGLDITKLPDMPLDDLRRIIAVIVKCASSPLTDPNSPSAST